MSEITGAGSAIRDGTLRVVRYLRPRAAHLGAAPCPHPIGWTLKPLRRGWWAQGDQVVAVDGVDVRKCRTSFSEALDQAGFPSSACMLRAPSLPLILPPVLPTALASHVSTCGRSRDSSML